MPESSTFKMSQLWGSLRRHPAVLECFSVDWRVSVLEIFPGPHGLRPLVPALAPGASAELELLVVAPLDPGAPGVELRVFASYRSL